MTASMPHLRICLLGRFEVRLGDSVVLDGSWNRSKSKNLLKLLALREGRPLHREQLMDILWPALDVVAAGRNLRKNLHYLRSRFQAHSVPDRVVTVTGDTLALSAAVRVDVDDFRAAAQAARATPHDAELYETALRLYVDDLLPEDLYEEWTTTAREELKAHRRDLLARVGALYAARGEGELAIDRLQQLLQTDPADEAAHRSLMRLYGESGSRHRALRQYARCREVLAGELGVDPDTETEALYRQILDGRLGRSSAADTVKVASLSGGARSPQAIYGREKELALAGEILAAAQRGRGQVLFILGSAGIGKSCFAERLLAAAEQAGGLTLIGRSYPLEAAVAYQPVREVLRQLTDVADVAIQEAIQGSLCLKRLLPGASLDTTPAADPALLRSALYEEAARLFHALGARQLVVVCFEDLHAADEASLGLIHVLGRQLASHCIIVVATHRSDEVASGSQVGELMASLRRLSQAQIIELGRLPDTVIERVVHDAFGGLPADSALVTELTRLAEGNPLFARELVHTLKEEGETRLVCGQWERHGTEPAPLPIAIRDMVNRRLIRLTEPSREALAAASVLGREFDYGSLRRALEVTEDGVLDAIDEAIGAYLVEETPTGYRFRHDLMREAIYRGLSRARRQLLHRRVGAALTEIMAAEDVHAEQAGYHFARSDEPWRAVPHLHHAARRAASVFANEQAIVLYDEALAIARSTVTERARLATMLEELGDLRSRVGHAPASARLLREALAVFTEIGDPESVLRVQAKAALALVVVGEVEEAGELLGAQLEGWRERIGEEFGEQYSSLGTAAAFRALAALRWHRGQHGQARDAAQQAVLVAEATGDVRQRARAYESLALACHALGDWEKGIEFELNREALGVGGFETDVVLDGHL